MSGEDFGGLSVSEDGFSSLRDSRMARRVISSSNAARGSSAGSDATSGVGRWDEGSDSLSL